MICSNCGRELEEDANFCKECGAKVERRLGKEGKNDVLAEKQK